MFFRYTLAGTRKTLDLKDLYYGQSVFLCGGHPSLKNEDLSLFNRHGVIVMAMNNTGTLVRPQLGIYADKPSCYSRSILYDPAILKFTRMVNQDQEIDGKKWREFPSTIFFGATTEGFTTKNILHDRAHVIWWYNVFIMAIQVCYRLGFRKIFLCGVGLSIEKNSQYLYPTNLDDAKVDYNKRTYNNVYNNIKDCLPHFKEYGLELISCTPESRANELLSFMPLPDAIFSLNHPEHDTINVKHSSEFKGEGSSSG